MVLLSRIWALLMAMVVMGAGSALAAPACEGGEGRLSYRIGGEVGGAHAYRETLPTGWTFALLPSKYGYDLRLFDDKGRDLSLMTPPLRFEPNPRQIYGWHFRNQANTGANTGDVNAPQDLRIFIFDPKGAVQQASQPVEVAGRGWLHIDDYGLADLAPGEKARMVYLKFQACLTWPGEEPPAPEPASFDPETVEIFGACGLDPSLTLDPYIEPLVIGGDFDGDGSHDHAAPIMRKADGKRGIAICRAGTWMNVLGLDEPMGELVPAYFDRMDYWGLYPKREVYPGAAGGEPPVLKGDAITVGMEEKSSVLIYWTGTDFQSYWQGD